MVLSKAFLRYLRPKFPTAPLLRRLFTTPPLQVENLKVQLAELEGQHGGTSAKLISPYNLLGSAYISSKDLPNAATCFAKALEIAETQLDTTEELAVGYKNLANTYRALGDLQNAQTNIKKALRVELEFYEESDQRVALTYNNIAALYMQNECYDEAYECLKKARPAMEACAAQGDHSVGTFFFNLGFVLSVKNLNSESLGAYHTALKVFEGLSDGTSEDVAEICYHLAMLHEKTGEFVQAGEYFSRVLACKHKFSQEEVAKVTSKLGSLNFELGDYTKAVELHSDALEVAKQLDPNNENLRFYHRNLAKAHQAKAEFALSQLHYEADLDITARFTGKDSSETAESYDNLANLFNIARNNPLALEYANKAVQIRENSENPVPEALATSYITLGNIQHSMGKLEEGQQLLEKAAKIARDSPDKSIVIAAGTSLGLLLKDKGSFEAAIGTLQRTIGVIKEFSGEDSMDLADAYGILGYILDSSGKSEDAITVLKDAIRLSQELNHPVFTARYLDFIGDAYRNCKDTQKALESHLQALDCKVGKITDSDLSLAHSYQSVANDYKLLKNYEKALEYQVTGNEAYERAFGSEHPLVAGAKVQLGDIYAELGKSKEALRMFNAALEIFVKTYGENVSIVQRLRNNIQKLTASKLF